MLKRDEILAALPGFYGTEHYYRHRLFVGKGLVLTDGCQYIRENADAHWLFDAILSHQHVALKDPSLRDIQFWKLRVAKDKTAVLTCERDQDDVAITQKLEYTDFPLEDLDIIVERGSLDGVTEEYVAMLPQER